MMEISFNEHKGLDSEGLAALLGEISAIEQASFSDPWSDRTILSTLSFEAELVTARECGELVAYAFFIKALPEGELLNIAVAPKKRRCGIARELLTKAFERLLADGVNRLYLEVRASNKPAADLYSSLGFLPVGIRKRYYKNPTEDAVVMAADF